MYCVRAEAGAEVGEGRVVAVNSRVGRGVSVGGTGVNVGTRVGVSSGATVPPTGWNGVDVGEAFGSTVTITSVGGAVFDVGRAQAVDIQMKRRRANRREIFINKCSPSLRVTSHMVGDASSMRASFA
ncbi:hypothetical protein EHM76_03720 [bacterium]|nr:MAG: hypothetical protein EHM76_03720 [bacterium]